MQLVLGRPISASERQRDTQREGEGEKERERERENGYRHQLDRQREVSRTWLKSSVFAEPKSATVKHVQSCWVLLCSADLSRCANFVLQVSAEPVHIAGLCNDLIVYCLRNDLITYCLC